MEREKSDLHCQTELLNFVPPMLLGYPDKKHLQGVDWDRRTFEVKSDGYRMQALMKSNPFGDCAVQLLSKSKIDYTYKYGRLVNDLSKLSCDMILDGELEALEERKFEVEPGNEVEEKLSNLYPGVVPNRNLLSQSPLHVASVDYRYVAFDVLYFKGKSLIDIPLSERRKILRNALIDRPDSIVLSPSFKHEDAQKLLAATQKFGLEAVVAKRETSPYLPGKRSDNWIKLKLSDFPK